MARDAYQYLAEIFSRYGLNTLTSWARTQLEQGSSPDQVMLDLYNTPEFKQRFPAIEQRRQKGLSPITPEDYIRYEETARDVFRRAGMPPSFYSDKNDYTNLIANDVSPKELEDRVMEGFKRVQNADPSVREAFGKFFGVKGDSALAALFIDPKRAATTLEEQARMAEVAGAGAMALGGWLTKDRAGQIVRAGVTAEEARSGFQRLGQIQGLFTESVGETSDMDIYREGVASIFGVDENADTYETAEDRQKRDAQRRAQETLSNIPGLKVPKPKPEPAHQVGRSAADAQADIDRRLKSRANAFGGGGGAAVGDKGVTGLKSDG